jgi:hypothetical protein
MPRLTLSQMVEQEERELIWLRALESGEITFGDLLKSTGLKRSQLYARLRRARENRPIEGEDADEPFNPDEKPYIPLVDQEVPGHHYRTDDDQLSVLPAGKFRIATGDRAGRRIRTMHAGDGGRVETPKKSEHKFKPKARKKGKRAG